MNISTDNTTFNHGLEFAAAEKIREGQSVLLARHIRYLQDKSAFYREEFREAGIGPDSFSGLDDLSRFPLTTKEDLGQHAEKFLCVDHSEIVDFCLTSGTTGKPTPLMQTRSDLERLGYNEELSFVSAGITSNDRVLIAAAIDRCFMAGLAYFLGLVRTGAAAIRAGSGSLPVLEDLVRTYRPTAMVGVPTLMLALGRRLKNAGDEPSSFGLSRLVCIGEPVREQDFSLSPLGQRLEELWGGRVFSTYASTEMATTFCECGERKGGHLHPDLIVTEILDDQGLPVQPGRPGEVVVTPVGVRGMPLLRFRTGDIAVMHAETCLCGRSSPRLGPVLGRQSQMLKIKGTTVFPNAIFSALQEMPQVENYYLEVRNRYSLSDEIRVVAGVRDQGLSPLVVAESIASRTRVKPEVELEDPDTVRTRTMVQGKRKPVVFFDYRDDSDE